MGSGIGSSFDSGTLSVNAIGSNPTVDATAIVPNLKSVALSGFDKVNVLEAVDFAEDDITDLKLIGIGRRDGA